MEETKLAMIAQLMFKQCGEEVHTQITKLPDNGITTNISYNNQYDAYVARTDSYTCLVHLYADGKVRVYVH